MKHCVILIPLLAGIVFASAQHFTRQDTLRGSITPQRAWWDVTYYDLNLTVNPENKSITGYNTIHYNVLEASDVLQIDLQEPLQITAITQEGQPLAFTSEGAAHFIRLLQKQVPGVHHTLTVHYSGQPRKAKNAPWDGGFSWEKDKNGCPFVATSCQGLGASAWWPNKDHAYDEVDSMQIRVTAPHTLTTVANGILRSVEEQGLQKTYTWFVSNPINNYGVNINIGDYVHFGEKYSGEKGVLNVDYYVLPYHLDSAKIHFKQVPLMLEAFEYWFGPYPFYEDGFKLVEVPYLGMEHQSSVTYGNHYQNGYLGRDLSNTGWGLLFDFIIIHESGHEWFANNITYRDSADMWIHEGFAAYSESLYLDYHYGTRAASEYMIGTRAKIKNDRPIIGPYHVNKRGSGDMYYKGANMLHTLRQRIDDDALWRQLLRGLNATFYHQTVTTQQVETYLSMHSGKELTAFFQQYLRTTLIPTLEYQLEGNTLTYRYTTIVPGFAMPLRIFTEGEEKWLFPTSEWKMEELPGDTLFFDDNFYIRTQRI